MDAFELWERHQAILARCKVNRVHAVGQGLPIANPDREAIERLLRPFTTRMPLDVYRALLRSTLTEVKALLPELERKYAGPPGFPNTPANGVFLERARASDPIVDQMTRSTIPLPGPYRDECGRLVLHAVPPAQLRSAVQTAADRRPTATRAPHNGLRGADLAEVHRAMGVGHDDDRRRADGSFALPSMTPTQLRARDRGSR